MSNRVRVPERVTESVAAGERDTFHNGQERVAESPPQSAGKSSRGAARVESRKEGGLQLRRDQIGEGILAVVISIGIVFSYYGYWIAWCAAWSAVWATGPDWFIKPSIEMFLIVCITIVIITLSIFKNDR